MRRGLLFLGMVLVWIQTNAQNFPRDTSYTLHSDYVKNIKRYPDIQRAERALAPDVSVQRDRVYKTVGKRALHLDYFQPKNQHRSGWVFILIHGGGWRTGDKGHMHVLSTILANQGYPAFAVEYRLSPEAPFPAGVQDINSVIAWIHENAKELGIKDKGYILLGGSAGAQLASLVGLARDNPDFFTDPDDKRGISIEGVVNMDGLLAFHHPDSEEGKSAAQWLGGDYETAGDNWEAASALNYGGKNSPPMLFIHSQFKRFQAGRENLIQILDQYDIYTKVYGIENSPHTFWHYDPWIDQVEEYVLGFMDKL